MPIPLRADFDADVPNDLVQERRPLEGWTGLSGCDGWQADGWIIAQWRDGFQGKPGNSACVIGLRQPITPRPASPAANKSMVARLEHSRGPPTETIAGFKRLPICAHAV